MLRSRLSWERDLIYLASGFCFALLLVLGWRYVASRSLPPPPPPQTDETSAVSQPAPRPSVTIRGRHPSEESPPLQPRSQDLPPDTKRSPEPHPAEITPSPLKQAGPLERGVQVPHTPAREEDQEVLRSFVQETLQQKINEDDNLRAILFKAAEDNLAKKKEGEP